MKTRILVCFQVVLLLIMISVPAAMANTGEISLSLSKTAASIGDSVTASGETAPNAWVPLKVIDSARNIVVFDAKRADADGKYSIDFKVPAGVSGDLTVVIGEGSNVATGTVNISKKSSSSSGKGGGGSGPAPKPVTSTTGEATVNPDAGGTISLGDEVVLEIPDGALTGTDVEVKIERVTEPPAAPAGFKILGDVYEFRVDDETSYSFNKAVTITFSFNPDELSPGEIPAVHYYDETKQKWTNLGGEVSDNTITVEIDHFTKFAVMAAKEEVEEVTLTDISGHWAENTIKKLVNFGAISGYPDGTFRPDKGITRAEFLTILVKAFELEPQSGKIFTDTAGHWAQNTIATAVYHGIASGYNADTFGPDDPITREQMAAMVVNAAELTPVTEETTFKDSSSISEWAQTSVATAVHHGIINGYPDNTVRPQGNATRAEAATVVINILLQLIVLVD